MIKIIENIYAYAAKQKRYMNIKSIFAILALLFIGAGQAWGQNPTIQPNQLAYCTGTQGTATTTKPSFDGTQWYMLRQAITSWFQTTTYYLTEGSNTLATTSTAPNLTTDGFQKYLFCIDASGHLLTGNGNYVYKDGNNIRLTTNSTNATAFTIANGIKISSTRYFKVDNGSFSFASSDNGNRNWTLVPVTFKKNTTIKFFNGDEEIQNNSAYNPYEMTIGGTENSLVAKLFWTGNTVTPIGGATFTYGTQPNPSATIDIVPATGAITPRGAGTAVISANYTGNSEYNATSGTYNLKIKKKQSKLSFGEATYGLTTDDTGTQIAASLVWDPDNGGNGSAIAGTVTYTSSDETVATVDGTGTLTILKTGETIITASFAGNDEAEGCPNAEYQLIVSEAGTRYTYNVRVSGGPKDGESNPYGRLIVSNAGGVNGEYANGAHFESTLLSRSNFSAKDVSTWAGGHTYVANIAVSEVINDKVDVQVSYAEQFTWTLTIDRQAVDDNAAGKGTSSTTPIVVYISGKPYRTSGAFTSTMGEMSSNFISATNIDGYEYNVNLDNQHHTITITYSVYTHRSPQQSTFIRLRNAHSAQYITHVGGESALKTTAKSEDAIIYFENLADSDPSTKGLGRFLFYKSGRFNTAASLADIGNDGSNIQFSNEGNTEYFTITVNSNLLLEEGASDGNGGNTLTTTESESNLSRWYIETLNALPVKITTAGHGYATLYSPVDLEVPVGVKAYVATERNTGSNGIDYLVTLKRLTTDAIPARTPVILFSEQAVEQDVTFNFPITSGVESLTGLWAGLTGTFPTISTTSGDYVLQPTQGSASVGFYPWASATLAPFKAYIPKAQASARSFRFVFDDDDEETAIALPSADSRQVVATRYYNLNGTELSAPVRGVTIQVDIYDDGSRQTRKFMGGRSAR